jgi:hypothetical protein
LRSPTARFSEDKSGNIYVAPPPVLVHTGKDRTQQWMLVRMEQSKDGDAAPTEGKTPD